MQKKTNRQALIIGGSSGMGLAAAKKLAIHGFDLIIVHRDRRLDLPAIEKNFEEIRALGVSLVTFNKDATRSEHIEYITQAIKVSKIPSVNFLMHSIAKGSLKAMTTEEGSALSPEDFRVTIDAMGINLYAWTRKLFSEGVLAEGAGIVSLSSEGNSKVWPNYAAVSAAKATLEAITRNIALEFAPYGIRANTIQAGITETASFKRIPGSDRLKENALARNPCKRLTTPEDIANVVYLLTTKEAVWINGTTIKADGGESLQ